MSMDLHMYNPTFCPRDAVAIAPTCCVRSRATQAAVKEASIQPALATAGTDPVAPSVKVKAIPAERDVSSAADKVSAAGTREIFCAPAAGDALAADTVSYTHLTLPTNREV